MIRVGMCVLMVATAPIVMAQTPVEPATKAATAADYVVLPNGELATGWKNKRLCQPNGQCDQAIVNPVTREIAFANGKWATSYAATGEGSAVVRRKSPSRIE